MNCQKLPKIRLRAIEPEDLDYLYRIENDKRLWDVGETNMPYSRYALHEYVANCPTDIYTDKQLRLMILSPEGETVGMVDLMNFDPRHQRAEIGIVVDKLHRRCGYAQAAIEEIKNYSIEIIHLHQLYAIVSKNNAHSLGLFQQAGFEATVTLKDWLFNGEKFRDAILFQYFF